MNDDVRNIVLGLVATAISASLGWLARTCLWRRRLRREQAFFGLPEHAESLLVVNRDPAATEPAVHRFDVFALLELSALIKECGAHAEVATQDTVRQGFGERTEFCVGGPASNRRTAAHLSAMLPGLRITTDPEPVAERGMFRIGGEVYRMEQGVSGTCCSRGSPPRAGPVRCSCSAARARSPTRPRPAIWPATTSGWPASTATARSYSC